MSKQMAFLKLTGLKDIDIPEHGSRSLVVLVGYPFTLRECMSLV